MDDNDDSSNEGDSGNDNSNTLQGGEPSDSECPAMAVSRTQEEGRQGGGGLRSMKRKKVNEEEED